MIMVPDQNQRVTLLGKLHCFHMHLGDQRTGGINHPQAAPRAVLANLGRYPVRAVDNPFSVGHFVFAVDKDRALAPQLVDYKAVVDNFLADINRRTKSIERNTYHIDRPHHPRAEPTRLQQQQSLSPAIRRHETPALVIGLLWTVNPDLTRQTLSE